MTSTRDMPGDTPQRRLTAAERRVVELVDEYPHLAWLTYVDQIYPANQVSGFLRDVARKFNKTGKLTQAQIDAVGRVVVADTERRLRAEQWEEERRAEESRFPNPTPVRSVLDEIFFRIEVLFIKNTVDDWTGEKKQGAVCRELTKGYKVYMRVPRKMMGEIQKGDVLGLEATVVPSERDPYFGFLKRPRRIVRERDGASDIL